MAQSWVVVEIVTAVGICCSNKCVYQWRFQHGISLPSAIVGLLGHMPLLRGIDIQSALICYMSEATSLASHKGQV